MPRGRRPVLQLESTIGSSSYLARYGYNSNSSDANRDHSIKNGTAILNLVGDYADSDNDSEDNEEAQPPVAPLPVSQKPEVQVPEESATVVQPIIDAQQPVIDDEVANFLAEIDAISTEEANSNLAPTPPLGELPPENEKQINEEKSESSVKDESPITDSICNNMFGKPNSEMPASDKPTPSVVDSKAKVNKYKSMFVKGTPEFVRKDKQDDVIVKLPKNDQVKQREDEIPEKPKSLWQQCMDENTKYNYYWHTITNQVTWEIPPEYTQYLLLYKEYKERMKKVPAETKRLWEKLKKEKKLKQENDKKKRLVEAEKEIPANAPLTKEMTLSLTNATSNEINKNLEKSELDDDKTNDHKTKSKSHSDKTNEKSPFRSDKRESEKRESEKRESEKRESEKKESSSEHRSRHKHKKNKKESKHRRDRHSGKSEHDNQERRSSADVEDMDIDFDEIDQALELALEKKKTELMELEDEEKSRHHHRRPKESVKRPSSPVSGEKPEKKRLVAYGEDDDDESEDEDVAQKQSETVEPTDVTVEKETSPRIPNLIQIKDDVEDQANVVLGKLEFLEVTKKGLSRLQVLLLEVQTRFRDWQDGGLDTDYFVKRLEDAHSQLKQYEQSAVPLGWSCHWDRNFRRYFYRNVVTGESRWDYPDVDAVAPPPPPMTTQNGDSTHDSQPINPPQSPIHEEETPTILPTDAEPSGISDTSEIYPTKLPDIQECEEPSVEVPPAADNDGDDMNEDETSTLEVAIHPEEPPPPGMESAQDIQTSPILDRREYSDDAASPPPSLHSDGEAVTDQKIPSPHSSDGAKEADDDDFDVDKMLEDTALSMKAESESVMSTAVIDRSPQIKMDVYAPPPFAPFDNLPSASPMDEQPYSPAPEDGVPLKSENDGADKTERKKKKKKEKKIASTSLSYKKKNVSSMVQKWHKVHEQVEQEEKLNEERQMAIRQKLEEWKQSHS